MIFLISYLSFNGIYAYSFYLYRYFPEIKFFTIYGRRVHWNTLDRHIQPFFSWPQTYHWDVWRAVTVVIRYPNFLRMSRYLRLHESFRVNSARVTINSDFSRCTSSFKFLFLPCFLLTYKEWNLIQCTL